MTQPVALVLRALYLGDMLTGLPALRMLRAALPQHRIVLGAPVQAGSLAMTAGVVDALTPALELASLTGAPRNADVAIDLHGNGPQSRAVLEATGAQRVVAFHGGRHHWRDDEHEVRRWCRLVGEGLRIPQPWPALAGSLPVPEPIAELAGVTVIHPGAKARSRQWPPQRYVEVARRLGAQGHRVVITGGPGERPLVDQVADAAAAPALTALSLPQLSALVAHARLVICGDTGIAHVASVFATPSVVLFGPVSPALWGPPADGPHRALWPATRHRGDPHADRPDPVLLSISVSEVVKASTELDTRSARRVHPGRSGSGTGS